MDLDHLVSVSLHRNRVAVLFRLLARNLQLGYQLDQAAGTPTPLFEWRRLRALLVEGAGAVTVQGMTIHLTITQPTPPLTLPLRWSGLHAHLAAAS